jgi:hypothetical protein
MNVKRHFAPLGVNSGAKRSRKLVNVLACALCHYSSLQRFTFADRDMLKLPAFIAWNEFPKVAKQPWKAMSAEFETAVIADLPAHRGYSTLLEV